jgi:hypothetical protein
MMMMMMVLFDNTTIFPILDGREKGVIEVFGKLQAP